MFFRPAAVLPLECSLIAYSRCLRAEPDGAADQGTEADDPGEQTLGNRPEVTQRGATGVRLRLQRLQVGDHVALVLRGDVLVVEHRHGLRAGEHGLVDVLRRGVLERGRVLAAGQGTTGAGEVVAHRAVDPEDVTTLGGVTTLRGRE